MRSSAGPFTSPSGLVDKRLQPMWEQIEQVRALLPQIAHVSYYMESLFNLDRNLSLLADENVDHHILKDVTIFQGASAYELALASGFIGSPEAWFASLKGDQGDPGVTDDATLLQIQTDIQTHTADILALTTLTNTLSSYTPLSTYNARVTSVNSSLASLQASVTALQSATPPVIPTNLQITTLAQGVYDASIPAVLSSLGLLGGRIDTADTLIAQLDIERVASDLAFSEFLVANSTTLTRVTALEASSTNQSASIVSLQSVTATAATDILVLEAESLTSAAQIVDLYSVTSDAATAINNLQVANNANNAAILNEQTVRVSDIAAAATDRTLIRTQFAAADAALQTDINTRATITQLATAESNAASANAALSSALTAAYQAADAGLQTQINTRATNTRVDTVESDAASARATIASNLLAETTNRTNADTALQGQITTNATAITNRATITQLNTVETTLTGSIATVSSNLSAETTARINADTALQTDINTRATLTQLATAESNATSANAALSSALTAAFQAADAGLQTQINNRATITQLNTVESDAAGARAALNTSLTTAFQAADSGLQGQINNRATISYVDSAVSTESSARASSISTLTSTVNGLSATVSTQGTTIAGINGRLNARYAISVGAGGAGAFISLEDGTTIPSKITLTASIIEFNADVIINGSLTRTQVEANAFTQNGATSQNSTFSTSITFTARGGVVLLWINYYNSGTTVRTWTITRNGVTVKTFTSNSLPATHLVVLDNPGSGSVTYTASCNLICNLIDMQFLEILR